MKKWLLHILYIVALSLVASCNTDFEDVDSLRSDVKVTFTLALGGQTVGSRASWGEDYTPSDLGNDYDNKIDVNGLQVVVYSVGENNRLEYMNKVEQILISQDNTNKNIYHFTGSLTIDKNLLRNQVKIMVFANCDTNIEKDMDIAALNYSYKTSRIPMWGVATYENLELIPGKLKDLGTIDLLRAMAKVEVSLDQKLRDEGYSLKGIILDKYNQSGYTLPQYYETISTTISLDTEEGFNPKMDIKGNNLSFEANKENGHYIAYLPEYDNTQQTTTMRVTLFKGEESVNLEKPYIYFKNYQDDTSINIIRNHYYQFKITGIDDAGKSINLSVNYSVAGWTDIKNPDISFGNGNGNVFE